MQEKKWIYPSRKHDTEEIIVTSEDRSPGGALKRRETPRCGGRTARDSVGEG